MSPAHLADVVLALGAFFVLASALGVLLIRQAYDKAHFVTPAKVVAAVLVRARGALA